jgi:hypothetical protein
MEPTSGLVTSEAGDTATFTMRLDSQPSATVAVSVFSSNTNEATISVLSMSFGVDDWNAAQTVTVIGMDDDVVDGDSDLNITFVSGSPDSNFDGILMREVRGTNLDGKGCSHIRYVMFLVFSL